jgi:hypothetical protein
MDAETARLVELDEHWYEGTLRVRARGGEEDILAIY